MAWKPPADAIEWTPPEDAIPFDESRDMMPGDLAGVTPQGIQGQQQAAPAGVPWYEALFPRSSAAAGDPAYSPRALAAAGLDVVSWPGRAYASLARPEGEGYLDAMARTTASPRASERGMLPWQEFSESLLRDPATLLLSAIPGGTAALPARLGWAGRGLVAGTRLGAGLAATRQAENLSAGIPLSSRETAKDVAIGAGLGLGGAVIGRGLEAAGKAAVPAAMKLAKVDRKYREGVERSMPEMVRRGMLGPTVGSMERRAAAMESDITGRYAAAKAGTEGVPAVPLGLYGERAAERIRSLADEARIGPEDEAAAIEWITARANRPAAALGGASPRMVDVPTAISARSTARKAAGSYESQAPSSARREAMQEAADEFALGINDRLAQVAPAVRAVDEFAAPYYQTRPYMDALARRGSNYEIGLTELGAASAGGLLGGASGGSGGSVAGAATLGALARLQRHPLYPYLLNQAGRASAAPGRYIPRGGMILRGSATDNARGR